MRPRLLVVREFRAAGLPLTGALALLNVALGAAPLGFVLATSVLIGRVPEAMRSERWDILWAPFAVAAGLFLLQQVLAPLQSALGELVKRRVDGGIYNRLMATASSGPGIAALEDPQAVASLSEASRWLQGTENTPGKACAGQLALIARYTRLLGLAAMLGVVTSWYLGLGLVGVVLLFRYGNRGGLRKYSVARRSLIAAGRRTDYLRDLASDAAVAKELRVFGLGQWLRGQYRDSYDESMDFTWRARRRVYVAPYLAITVVAFLATAGLLAAVATRSAAGELSLTALSLAVQAIAGGVLLGDYYAEADVPTQFGMTANRAADEFRQRARELAPTPAPDDAPGRQADPSGLPRAHIRCVGLTFQYPGAARPTLNGLDLELRAGQCTAIVGVNGAGKTTLVNLLGRLYEPTAGRLEVDGIDARTFDVDQWRRRLSVVFQDFIRYDFTAADNIALGAPDVPFSLPAVREAAERAGVLEILERLPRGLQTPMSTQYTDGASLSGGQWQALAISRAVYAMQAGAQVLVLDEPTSALDIRAEARFYENFLEATRGATTVLISHRFSTVRRADHIVVLADGRVLEQGSHAELVAAGGRYAEMFALQATLFAGPVGAPAEATEGGA
ncbi:ABC transporter ATP-binding protein [Dactylosporangium sp. NPDC051484]|uniref:ABC transporter ATP-binding protein n=1 Tax=Dactylosporangium sp. NPDC051484 TaxID=3154942 RepID=UPI00344E01E3